MVTSLSRKNHSVNGFGYELDTFFEPEHRPIGCGDRVDIRGDGSHRLGLGIFSSGGADELRSSEIRKFFIFTLDLLSTSLTCLVLQKEEELPKLKCTSPTNRSLQTRSTRRLFVSLFHNLLRTSPDVDFLLGRTPNEGFNKVL